MTFSFLNVILATCFSAVILLSSGCKGSKEHIPEPDGNVQEKPPSSNFKEEILTDESLKQAKTLRDETDLLTSELKKLLSQQYDKIVVVGRIDANFHQEIVDLIPENKVALLISSKGGQTHFAMRSAQLISESGHTVSVKGICASACAEYLLPAASSVEFIGSPLIGFHGNPMVHVALVKEKRSEGVVACEPDYNHISRMKALYKKHGTNPNFWKTQLEHLEMESVSFVDVSIPLAPEYQKMVDSGISIPNHLEDCVSAVFETKHIMWFPTSKQLREEFGLKFTGSVCADDPNCYPARLDRLGKPGDSYVVGDTVYTVK